MVIFSTIWSTDSNTTGSMCHTTLITYSLRLLCICIWWRLVKQAVGGRPPRYVPTLFSPRGASRRRADGNVAAVSYGQHIPTPTAAVAWRANTAVSKAVWWPWPFELESGVRVTCDVGYLCANFSIPRPLCSRLRPDVRDIHQTGRRQTDVRQHYRFIPHLLRAGA